MPFLNVIVVNFTLEINVNYLSFIYFLLNYCKYALHFYLPQIYEREIYKSVVTFCSWGRKTLLTAKFN